MTNLPPDIPVPALEDHGHSHAAGTGHPWLDKALPVSAILISIVSLGVAIHHGGIMNEMAENNARAAEASIWPFLQLDSGNTRGNDKGTIFYDIVNKGVGPARIETFEFFYQSKAYANAQELLAACCIAAGSSTRNVRTLNGEVAPGVLAPKDTSLVFEFKREGEAIPAWDKYNGLLRSGVFSAKACYCSVFDKCWTTDFKSAKRAPVKACPPAKLLFGSTTK